MNLPKSPSFDEELARWRQLSKGAIGNKVSLLVVFLSTTPIELREQIRDAIMCGNDFKTY